MTPQFPFAHRIQCPRPYVNALNTDLARTFDDERYRILMNGGQRVTVSMRLVHSERFIHRLNEIKHHGERVDAKEGNQF